MSDSPLSFGSSSSFRNNLLTKNLEPYNVPGVYTPPSGQIVKETILTVSSVVDSNSLYELKCFISYLI